MKYGITIYRRTVGHETARFYTINPYVNRQRINDILESLNKRYVGIVFWTSREIAIT